MKARIADYAMRGVIALILIPVGYLKFVADKDAVAMFQALDMEPHGRVVIGLIEITAGLLLISPAPAPGALLAFSVMLGAVIAHTTRLGIVVGDGGAHAGLLAVVLTLSVIVLLRHRGSLPLVGSTLQDKV